jgi:hypothetical protein
LRDQCLKRCETALAYLEPPEPLDIEAAGARVAQLIGDSV